MYRIPIQQAAMQKRSPSTSKRVIVLSVGFYPSDESVHHFRSVPIRRRIRGIPPRSYPHQPQMLTGSTVWKPHEHTAKVAKSIHLLVSRCPLSLAKWEPVNVSGPLPDRVDRTLATSARKIFLLLRRADQKLEARQAPRASHAPPSDGICPTFAI